MLCRRQLLVASLAVASCIVTCTPSEDRRAAEQTLDQHFNALKTRAYEAALSDYDKHFFSEVNRAEWRSALTSVGEKLGTFRSYEVTSFRVTYKQVAGPGTYLKFDCRVTYSKHTSNETLYLYRKQGAAKFTIIGHEIDADGLNR